MCATYDLLKQEDESHTKPLTTTMCRTNLGCVGQLSKEGVFIQNSNLNFITL